MAALSSKERPPCGILRGDGEGPRESRRGASRVRYAHVPDALSPGPAASDTDLRRQGPPVSGHAHVRSDGRIPAPVLERDARAGLEAGARNCHGDVLSPTFMRFGEIPVTVSVGAEGGVDVE